MADKPGKFGSFSLLFGFEYPLQVTLWSWYVDVKYLAYGVLVLSSLKMKGQLYESGDRQSRHYICDVSIS
jgi:hypothetical protein